MIGPVPAAVSLRTPSHGAHPPVAGKARLRGSARRGDSVAPAAVRARYAPKARAEARPTGFATRKPFSAQSPCAPFVPALFRPPRRAPSGRGAGKRNAPAVLVALRDPDQEEVSLDRGECPATVGLRASSFLGPLRTWLAARTCAAVSGAHALCVFPLADGTFGHCSSLAVREALARSLPVWCAGVARPSVLVAAVPGGRARVGVPDLLRPCSSSGR